MPSRISVPNLKPSSIHLQLLNCKLVKNRRIGDTDEETSQSRIAIADFAPVHNSKTQKYREPTTQYRQCRLNNLHKVRYAKIAEKSES